MDRIKPIDAIRGLCLINIFINHNSLGVLAKLSFSRLSFSDSADIFVFLAGLSTYMAYVGIGSFRFQTIMSVWVRATRLYMANAVILLVSFVLIYLAATMVAAADPRTLPHVVLARVGIEQFLWHVGTMQQSVGYSAVLRLYIYLLLASPLWLWLATRRFWYPIVPATLLWALAGHYGWVASDSLTGIRLNLTIIPWNLVFVLGIAMGAALRQGVSLKRSKVVDTLAFGYLILVPIVMAIGVENSREIGIWLSERNDHFWFGASKTLQSPLRLLSLICLVYVFVAHRDAPIIRLFYRIDVNHFLCRLGRRSLDVFVVGALLAIINEWSIWALLTIQSPVLRTISCFICEVTFIAVGVRIMLLVADRPRSFFAARSKPGASRALANGDPACQGVANDNCLPNRDGSGHKPDGSQLRAT